MNIHQLIERLEKLRDETKWQEIAPTVIISDGDGWSNIDEVFDSESQIVIITETTPRVGEK